MSNETTKSKRAIEETKVLNSRQERRMAMAGVSFEIAAVKPGLVTLWSKATMKMIKGLATLNNFTIKYMKSTSRIPSMLIDFLAVKPYSQGVL